MAKKKTKTTRSGKPINKEVDEKEGLKLLKDKKYKELPEYIEQ